MNTANIKKYAPLARNAFITAVTKRANELGIYDSHIEEAIEEGQTLKIEGRSVDLKLKGARNKLISQVESTGFTALMEHIAYTWFNRLCAIRYMELHDYLDHGLRVLSHPDNNSGFEILEHAQDVAEDLGLSRDQIIELKLAGNQDELLYRTLLLGQCHALHKAMPFLFEAIDDETELLLPDNLIRTDSILRGLVNDIPAEDWEQVEVIGWLYQFYISEKKDEVIGKVVKSEDIPAATQLFTPNWIVKYLVQNSVGRQWLQTYPDSSIKAGMDYYIEPAEQTDKVNAQIKAITPDSIEPESIKVLDPACGSGHILVEAYQVLKAIYIERGFRDRDIPKLILENNLFGLDIDDRAAQLAGFALMMMAREDDRRIFTRDIQLNVIAMQSTAGISLQNEDCLVIQDEQQREEFVKTVQDLLKLFEQAKIFGSLIAVPEHIADYLPTAESIVKQLADSGDLFAQNAALTLMPLIRQAEILSNKYDAVVANPPYMGKKAMNADLKKWARRKHPKTWTDLFAMFMEGAFDLLKPSGYNAQINMQSWMFLSSYEGFRDTLLQTTTPITLAHLGPRAFSQISGEVVQTTAFIFQNLFIDSFRPTFFRLINGNENQKKSSLLLKESKYDHVTVNDFSNIPSKPIAYWVPRSLYDAFKDNKSIDDIAPPRIGMMTTDNERFLRSWYEIDFFKIGFEYEAIQSASESTIKWFPYNKGGGYRKWAGFQSLVVNWEKGGEAIKKNGMTSFRGKEFYFKSGLTWSDVATGDFSCRYTSSGFIFDIKGTSAFPSEELLGLVATVLNSKVGSYILKALNPTMSYQSGDVRRVPLTKSVVEKSYWLNGSFHNLVKISLYDWNLFEISWEFKKSPLITLGDDLEAAFISFNSKSKNMIKETKNIELEINELLIEKYGLEKVIDSEVSDKEITLKINPLYRYGSQVSDDELNDHYQSDVLSELISYVIGCMMGRYSLDQEGLVYAHASNDSFTELVQQGTYKTFQADDDGIIPLTDQEWFADDVTHRFREFVRVVLGEDNLQANLDFVAESLCLYAIKSKSGESSLETIRRYLSTKFYKDHLKTYKKRPIYWLFSSGKQKAFECLVYLHRYNESTLSRMRTEYVTPLLGKYEASAIVLEKQMQDASTTAESNRFKKSLTALEKKQTELSEFDDKLKHYADMRISLDLDEGVKVNYGKFGDLLAEVKAITGKKA